MPQVLTCAECGNPMYGGPGSLPQGEATCRPCRRLCPRPYKTVRRSASKTSKTPCVECACPSWGERCRRCRDLAQRIRSDNDHRVQRWQREHSAPGLSEKARRQLRIQWMKQGRPCAYCSVASAETVDHVVPLVRGGTNHEGNLVPCCKRCNSSKAARTVAEWRHGRQPQRALASPAWAMRPVKVKPRVWAEQVPLFTACVHCAEPHDRRSPYCTERCRYLASRTPSPQTVKTCEDCGEVFSTPRKKQRFCSRACGRRAERRRYRASDHGREIRRAQKTRAKRRADTPGAPLVTHPRRAA
jgi:hypothetical protein